MAKNFIWKLWLLPNLLTKEVTNDSIADVSTAGTTKHNEDIAKAIKEDGSDLQVETLLDVLNRGDRVRRRFLLEGYSVQTDIVHLAPRVTGNWLGADPLFDPKEHKITVNAIPTAGLRKALEEEVGVEVLGKKTEGGAVIGLVTDAFTGKTDGTISVYGNLIITGEKIKIAPLNEAGLGVFFVAADGTETPDSIPLTVNDPKKLIAHVPALTDGVYTLKIVTRYSQATTLLKHPRTIVYELPLTVKNTAP
jgi:hypothetical protein